MSRQMFASGSNRKQHLKYILIVEGTTPTITKKVTKERANRTLTVYYAQMGLNKDVATNVCYTKQWEAMLELTYFLRQLQSKKQTLYDRNKSS